MILIVNIDFQKFTINGIPYWKNFMPVVNLPAAKIKIVNAYDSTFELMEFKAVGDVSVDGQVYTTLVDLQTALLPVIYTRDNLGTSISSLPAFNKFIRIGGVIKTGQTVTFNAGWTWLLNAVSYMNPNSLSYTLPFASVGKHRIDKFVANNINTFTYIQGVEVDLIDDLVSPPTPINTLEATFILVTNDGIAIEEPANLGLYINTFVSYASFIADFNVTYAMFGYFAYILNTNQNILCQHTGGGWKFTELNRKRFFSNWSIVNNRTFILPLGVKAQQVFINEVLTYSSGEDTVEWYQTDNILTISDTVLVDDNSRILILN